MPRTDTKAAADKEFKEIGFLAILVLLVRSRTISALRDGDALLSFRCDFFRSGVVLHNEQRQTKHPAVVALIQLSEGIPPRLNNEANQPLVVIASIISRCVHKITTRSQTLNMMEDNHSPRIGKFYL